MREVLNHMLRDAPQDRLVYMRDVYDHVVTLQAGRYLPVDAGQIPLRSGPAPAATRARA